MVAAKLAFIWSTVSARSLSIAPVLSTRTSSRGAISSIFVAHAVSTRGRPGRRRRADLPLAGTLRNADTEHDPTALRPPPAPGRPWRPAPQRSRNRCRNPAGDHDPSSPACRAPRDLLADSSRRSASSPYARARGPAHREVSRALITPAGGGGSCRSACASAVRICHGSSSWVGVPRWCWPCRHRRPPAGPRSPGVRLEVEQERRASPGRCRENSSGLPVARPPERPPGSRCSWGCRARLGPYLAGSGEALS